MLDGTSVWELIAGIPFAVKELALIVTTIIGTIKGVGMYRKNKSKGLQDVAELYKKGYINNQIGMLKATELGAKQRRLLQEIEIFCTQCCQEAQDSTGIYIKDLSNKENE